MGLSLAIRNDDVLTTEEKKEIDLQMNEIISKHRGNSVEINKLVFDSVTALTASESRREELEDQGALKRFWGGLTGKNKGLQSDIDRNLQRAQYSSQQTLQKLAEQNLMSFELITAVNNKLNSSILEVENEINNIYKTLITFFKQSKSELIQIENRVEKLEKNVNLLNWVNTIEYRTFNGVEYIDIGKIEKIVCMVRDFYDITKGTWTTSDLLLLKSALSEIGLSSKEYISYKEFIQYVSENEEIYNKLICDNVDDIASINVNQIVILNGLIKVKLLETSEKYIVNTVKSQLKNYGVDENEKNLRYSIEESYLKETAFIDVSSEVTLFDFMVELLLNLKILDYAISDKYNNNNIDFEGMDFDIVTKYAKKGNAKAQYNIAKMYWNEEVTQIDEEEAFRYAQLSADQGNAEAQFLFAGMLCHKENLEDNIQDILKYFELSANKDNVDAQFALGSLYYGGDESCNLKQDYDKALFWFRRAADQGSADAQHAIGEIYYWGHGVEQDYGEAIKWNLKSAYQGNADAQFRLGYIYNTGEGISKDYNEAVNWYIKSAEQGNSTAQNNLGICYKNGEGVDIDYYKAVDWYRKSAEQGCSSGQCNLGFMYLDGKGVNQDREEARKWFEKSAEQGYERAQKALRDNF